MVTDFLKPRLTEPLTDGQITTGSALMNETTCIHCEKKVETERVYHKKDPDTFFDRCTECGEPVSGKDGVIKTLMLEITHSDKRTNLVIFAGITIFVIISLIREFF
jgi:hypothetical protein